MVSFDLLVAAIVVVTTTICYSSSDTVGAGSIATTVTMTEVATELRKSSRIESVTEKINKEKSIRRSGRDPSIALLERTDVKRLLWKIRTNQKDTVVLKVKHHILADINSVVLDEIIAALAKNRCCQVSQLTAHTVIVLYSAIVTNS